MARVADWVEGARLRTLPAAVAPVLIGTGAAASVGSASAGRAVLAGLVALAMQVGVNYANDYSDGVRGTDDVRTGPTRLTASGLTTPGRVKAASFISFGLGALAGLTLVIISAQWGLLILGVLCVIAAWGYTGGANPYGYLGLGEVFVFVFFGLAATLGTTWTQAIALPWTAWAGATGVGLLSCALLMVNNIRDLATDKPAGKRTLAVRLGDQPARRVYAAMILVAIVLGALCGLDSPLAAGVVVLLMPAGRIIRRVLTGARGMELVGALQATGIMQLAYGVLLGLGLAISV